MLAHTRAHTNGHAHSLNTLTDFKLPSYELHNYERPYPHTHAHTQIRTYSKHALTIKRRLTSERAAQNFEREQWAAEKADLEMQETAHNAQAKESAQAALEVAQAEAEAQAQQAADERQASFLMTSYDEVTSQQLKSRRVTRTCTITHPSTHPLTTGVLQRIHPSQCCLRLFFEWTVGRTLVA